MVLAAVVGAAALKALHGTARAEVAASLTQCRDFLADVERYPQWHPDVVRRVSVSDRRPDGTVARAMTRLHVSQGPLTRDFELLISVEPGPVGVVLDRVAHGPGDDERFTVSWRLHEGSHHTAVELSLDAELSVPRLLPLGGIGDSLARGFVDAAVRALEGDR